jgi:hypothetical protein
MLCWIQPYINHKRHILVIAEPSRLFVSSMNMHGTTHVPACWNSRLTQAND